MGEIIFNSLADKKHSATSAGTQVLEAEGQKLKDRPSASEVLAVLKEIGLDASENTRTQLTPELVERADIIINMAEAETLPGYLIKSPKVQYWDVTDPFDQPLEFTRKMRDRISDSIKALLNTLDQ